MPQKLRDHDVFFALNDTLKYAKFEYQIINCLRALVVEIHDLPGGFCMEEFLGQK